MPDGSLSAPQSDNPVAFQSIPQKDRGSATQDFGYFSPKVQYGVETWTFCWGPANDKTQPVCLSESSVNIYPKTTATTSNALVLGTEPTTIAASYAGDGPRIKVEIDNAYPGGTTWVAFYSGSLLAASANIPPVAGSSFTNSTTNLYPQRFVTLDTGNYITNMGTYTIQVLQNSPYGIETLAAATFQIGPFRFNAEIGLTKYNPLAPKRRARPPQRSRVPAHFPLRSRWARVRPHWLRATEVNRPGPR
jgi:hypothetical protein